jgi:hypothetical protein
MKLMKWCILMCFSERPGLISQAHSIVVKNLSFSLPLGFLDGINLPVAPAEDITVLPARIIYTYAPDSLRVSTRSTVGGTRISGGGDVRRTWKIKVANCYGLVVQRRHAFAMIKIRHFASVLR